VNYIQIPTTLIAQVDAAIGGKTAVNHTNGKNMIGAFYQPRCVITDVDVLKTLPEREYIAGLAEVIKYGLIRDPQFFSWLEKNISALLAKDNTALLYAVHLCSKMKAEIVSQDERDQGIRNLLNLGHTFGHALETANDYQDLLHGEAVAIGITMAAKLSVELGWLSAEELERILNVLHLSGLIKNIDLPAASDFIQLMRRDKKIQAGKLNLILLKGIGHAVKTSDVSEAQLMDFFRMK
jgi:3-dehydroquinate synthase